MLHPIERNKGVGKAVKQMPLLKIKDLESGLGVVSTWTFGSWGEMMEICKCTDQKERSWKRSPFSSLLFFLLCLAIPFVGGKGSRLFFRIVLYLHPYQQLPDPGLQTNMITVTSSADLNAIKQPVISFLNSGEYDICMCVCTHTHIINQ